MCVAMESEKENVWVFWKMKLRPHFGASKKAFSVSHDDEISLKKNVGKYFFIAFINYKLIQKDQENRM